MFPRNSPFDLNRPIRLVSISIASTGFMSLRTLCRMYTHFNSSSGRSSSSLRVPEAFMLIAGQMRLSTSLRSRCSSEFPVPLNSSKITSSIRLPVSTRAVAMMVSDPPSSMFRAAPKNRVGPVLDQPLGLLDHHLGHLDVPAGRLVERARHHLRPRALHRPQHVRHL